MYGIKKSYISFFTKDEMEKEKKIVELDNQYSKFKKKEDYERRLIQIDLDHKVINKYEFEKLSAKIDLDNKKIKKNKYEKRIAKLDLNHKKITSDEYEKQIATIDKEPYVKVIKIEWEKGLPNTGSFELDWNEYWIEELVNAGYIGNSPEDIVNTWFNDIAKNMLLAEYNNKNFVKNAPDDPNIKVSDPEPQKSADGRVEKY